MKIAIVGGGAAGFFAALTAKQMAAVETADIVALAPSQFSALSTAAVAALTSAQVEAMDSSNNVMATDVSVYVEAMTDALDAKRIARFTAMHQKNRPGALAAMAAAYAAQQSLATK